MYFSLSCKQQKKVICIICSCSVIPYITSFFFSLVSELEKQLFTSCFLAHRNLPLWSILTLMAVFHQLTSWKIFHFLPHLPSHRAVPKCLACGRALFSAVDFYDRASGTSCSAYYVQKCCFHKVFLLFSEPLT